MGPFDPMHTPIGKILAEQRGKLLGQLPLQQLSARVLGQRIDEAFSRRR
jgi:hypothetical protein